jgi:hypothetical protein
LLECRYPLITIREHAFATIGGLRVARLASFAVVLGLRPAAAGTTSITARGPFHR